jgi:probable phosphoglycerate mutase
MKVYIVRHGETKWNTEGRMQGWKNSDLTDKGIQGAIKLGQRLKNVEFDYVYSSPAGRAVETTKCILGDKSNEIILCDDLKEMGFGSWEGMKHTEVEERYPLERFNLWNKPHLYKTIDGENFEEVLERTKNVINMLNQNSLNGNVLLVSHAVFIKAIYAVIKNYSVEQFWSPPNIDNVSLTVLEIDNEKMNFILESDTSHLN